MKNLNEYDKLVICNGCRPAWLSDKILDSIEKHLAPFFDLEFKSCCNQHDVDYYVGGTRRDFKRANKKFYKCMKKQISKKSYKKLEKTKWYKIKWKNVKTGFFNVLKAPKITFLKFKAWEYYKLVSKFGKSSFYFNTSGIKRLLPSYIPYKDPILREKGIQTVWKHNRWWTREEINKIKY